MCSHDYSVISYRETSVSPATSTETRDFVKKQSCWARWHKPEILALRRLKKKQTQEIKVILNYTSSSKPTWVMESLPKDQTIQMFKEIKCIVIRKYSSVKQFLKYHAFIIHPFLADSPPNLQVEENLATWAPLGYVLYTLLFLDGYWHQTRQNA